MLFTRITFVLLAIVTIADITLLAYVKAAIHSERKSGAVFRDNLGGSPTYPPGGYSAAGERISPSGPAGRGWVVRYASPSCEFCRADEAQWSILKSQLIAKGYQIYALSPSLHDAYSDRATELAGETQIPFVDVDWIKNARFRGTPITLLLDARGRVIWTHTGTLEIDDQKAATRADLLNR
jgi:hypothetical protein